ncbi:hypothetical protein CPC08DRAFT_44292 [Agrocybe pediades]|nr:hypothetical protein CPC08DRAFT_44292 [Agrocybe pediades]
MRGINIRPAPIFSLLLKQTVRLIIKTTRQGARRKHTFGVAAGSCIVIWTDRLPSRLSSQIHGRTDLPRVMHRMTTCVVSHLQSICAGQFGISKTSHPPFASAWQNLRKTESLFLKE